MLIEWDEREQIIPAPMTCTFAPIRGFDASAPIVTCDRLCSYRVRTFRASSINLLLFSGTLVKIEANGRYVILGRWPHLHRSTPYL